MVSPALKADRTPAPSTSPIAAYSNRLSTLDLSTRRGLVETLFSDACVVRRVPSAFLGRDLAGGVRQHQLVDAVARQVDVRGGELVRGPTNGSTSGTSASSVTGQPGRASRRRPGRARGSQRRWPVEPTRFTRVRKAVARSVTVSGVAVSPVGSTISLPATTISSCGSASSWASVGMVMSSAPRGRRRCPCCSASAGSRRRASRRRARRRRGRRARPPRSPALGRAHRRHRRSPRRRSRS